MNLKMVGLITNYLRNARFKGAVRAILFRGDLTMEWAGWDERDGQVRHWKQFMINVLPAVGPCVICRTQVLALDG